MNVADSAYHTVHDYAGGSAALAARLGIKGGEAVLNSKVNPNTSTHHLRLDEAVKLMAFTNDYRILQAAAFELGFICIRLPQSSTHQELNVMNHVLEIGQSKGDLCATIKEIFQDGEVSPAEVRLFDSLAKKICSEVMTLSRCLKQLATKKPVNKAQAFNRLPFVPTNR